MKSLDEELNKEVRENKSRLFLTFWWIVPIIIYLLIKYVV